MRPIVVMGVAGCGKSTVARLAAERLGCSFIEGDAYHPPANVEKMRRGEPLTDADRGPWLDAVRDRMVTLQREEAGVAVACSALRQSYRDRLRMGVNPPPRFVHLAAPYEPLLRRMQARQGHYMPPSLLRSQFETPSNRRVPTEGVVVLDALRPVEELVEAVMGMAT